MKIKVKDFDEQSARELKEKALKKLMAFKGHPFANKVYIALKTGLPYEFVKEHWDKLSTDNE